MADPFFEPYDREEIAYGDVPSSWVAAFVEQNGGGGRALDLGAGAGRDTIALAKAGFHVTAVDLSQRGLERVMQRAAEAGVSDRIEAKHLDVRDLEIPPASFDAVVATTVLDHISAHDAVELWQKIAGAVTDDGFLFVEVHTTEDPGCAQAVDRFRDAPVSETADAVINYFEPNQLLRLACDSESNLRVLCYEERQEWDYTHGPEHLHGKAILLAVRREVHPLWYGQPPAFPRNCG